MVSAILRARASLQTWRERPREEDLPNETAAARDLRARSVAAAPPDMAVRAVIVLVSTAEVAVVAAEVVALPPRTAEAAMARCCARGALRVAAGATRSEEDAVEVAIVVVCMCCLRAARRSHIVLLDT